MTSTEALLVKAEQYLVLNKFVEAEEAALEVLRRLQYLPEPASSLADRAAVVLLQALYETKRFTSARHVLGKLFGDSEDNWPINALLLWLSLELESSEGKTQAQSLILRLLETKTPGQTPGWTRRRYLALLHLYIMEVLIPCLRDPSEAKLWLQRQTFMPLEPQERSFLEEEITSMLPGGGQVGSQGGLLGLPSFGSLTNQLLGSGGQYTHHQHRRKSSAGLVALDPSSPWLDRDDEADVSGGGTDRMYGAHFEDADDDQDAEQIMGIVALSPRDAVHDMGDVELRAAQEKAVSSSSGKAPMEQGDSTTLSGLAGGKGKSENLLKHKPSHPSIKKKGGKSEIEPDDDTTSRGTFSDLDWLGRAQQAMFNTLTTASTWFIRLPFNHSSSHIGTHSQSTSSVVSQSGDASASTSFSSFLASSRSSSGGGGGTRGFGASSFGGGERGPPGSDGLEEAWSRPAVVGTAAALAVVLAAYTAFKEKEQGGGILPGTKALHSSKRGGLLSGVSDLLTMALSLTPNPIVAPT